MTKKHFGIYFNQSDSRLEDGDCIYQLHKPYKTIEKAMIALNDLCKTPKNKRTRHYIILPIQDISNKLLKVNKEVTDETTGELVKYLLLKQLK